MKLTKKQLDNLIQEELGVMNELDIIDWFKKLKAISPSKITAKLRGTTSKDLTGIQKTELQRIMGAFEALKLYAKDDNLYAGPVDLAFDRLEAALNKAGILDKIVAGDESGEEGSTALPDDAQANIIATLTGLRNGEINPQDGKVQLVQALKDSDLFSPIVNENNVFTVISFLNENKIFFLGESLSSFTKHNMKVEILTEIKNLQKDKILLEALDKSKAEDIRNLINMLDTAKPDRVIGITNSIFKILKDSEVLSPNRQQQKDFEMSSPGPRKVKLEPEPEAAEPPSADTSKADAENIDKLRKSLDKNPINNYKHLTKDLKLKELLYRHLHNLSEQGIIKLDDNQKRIVETMMIAETQLQIDKQLKNMLRR